MPGRPTCFLRARRAGRCGPGSWRGPSLWAVAAGTGGGGVIVSPWKRNLAIGLAALVVLATVAALSLRGCNPPGHVAQQDVSQLAMAGSAAAVVAPASPVPTAEQSARKGQIYYHREMLLSKIIPGEGFV